MKKRRRGERVQERERESSRVRERSRPSEESKGFVSKGDGKASNGAILKGDGHVLPRGSP